MTPLTEARMQGLRTDTERRTLHEINEYIGRAELFIPYNIKTSSQLLGQAKKALEFARGNKGFDQELFSPCEKRYWLTRREIKMARRAA